MQLAEVQVGFRLVCFLSRLLLQDAGFREIPHSRECTTDVRGIPPCQPGRALA